MHVDWHYYNYFAYRAFIRRFFAYGSLASTANKESLALLKVAKAQSLDLTIYLFAETHRHLIKHD